MPLPTLRDGAAHRPDRLGHDQVVGRQRPGRSARPASRRRSSRSRRRTVVCAERRGDELVGRAEDRPGSRCGAVDDALAAGVCALQAADPRAGSPRGGRTACAPAWAAGASRKAIRPIWSSYSRARGPAVRQQLPDRYARASAASSHQASHPRGEGPMSRSAAATPTASSSGRDRGVDADVGHQRHRAAGFGADQAAHRPLGADAVAELVEAAVDGLLDVEDRARPDARAGPGRLLELQRLGQRDAVGVERGPSVPARAATPVRPICRPRTVVTSGRVASPISARAAPCLSENFIRPSPASPSARSLPAPGSRRTRRRPPTACRARRP